MDFDEQTYVSDEVPMRDMGAVRAVRRIREMEKQAARHKSEMELIGERLGFTEDVYHWTNSKEVFDNFRIRRVGSGVTTPDVVYPDAGITPSTMQNYVGIHVGNARAAEDRYLTMMSVFGSSDFKGDMLFNIIPIDLTQHWRRQMKKEDLGKWANVVEEAVKAGQMGGMTIPLKARLTKPYIPPGANRVMSERTMTRLFASIVREAGLNMMDSPRESVEAVRKFFIDQGYDHIPYTNQVEDKGSISAIVLLPDVSLRFRTAEFKATGKGPLAGAIAGTLIIPELSSDD